jgi:coproporphyrinogen III oxidase
MHLSTSSAPSAPAVKEYLVSLQASIVAALERVDGASFRRDDWQRTMGSGTSCILEDSAVLERAGVGFSHVMGSTLPPAATAAHPELSGLPWQAMGVSLVVHPRNPHVPTVHMNVRFFIAGDEPDKQTWWFGGGIDLTPYYTIEADVRHFHQSCRDALLPFEEAAAHAGEPDLHQRFKQWCDTYFFLKHRQEARGVGGIFFDDFNLLGFEQSFLLQQHVGNAFLPAYLPLLEMRMHTPYGERERAFQAYRRARYVEFNLVLDRGTLFGLQSGGRTESILMSMPPTASWRYDWHPEPDSPEAQLYTDFLPVRDWLS